MLIVTKYKLCNVEKRKETFSLLWKSRIKIVISAQKMSLALYKRKRKMRIQPMNNCKTQHHQNFGMAEFTEISRNRLVNYLGETVVSQTEKAIGHIGGNELKISYLGQKGSIHKFRATKGEESCSLSVNRDPLSGNDIQRIVYYMSKLLNEVLGIF